MSERLPTRVYKLRFSEGFEWLLPVDEGDFDKLRFDGTRRADSWRPVRMRRLVQSDQGKTLRPSDFPACSGGDMLVLSRAAKEAIGAYLQQYGELLPLESDGGEFWTFNATTVLDALNEPASQVLRASDTGAVLLIRRPVFVSSALEGAGLFKVAQTPRGLIYATDEFVRLTRATRLDGLEFDPVWTSNP